MNENVEPKKKQERYCSVTSNSHTPGTNRSSLNIDKYEARKFVKPRSGK